MSENEKKPIMSDVELIEIALYKVLDRNVENLQTQIKLWLKKENDESFEDGEIYSERLHKLTKALRSTCDEIDQYAEKLDENISKQINGDLKGIDGE